MRTFLAGLFLLCSIASSATVRVNVSSPVSGATVKPAFTVNATATTNRHRITGWYIYVDDNAVWNTSSPASSISVPLTVAAGSHKLLVRAWDNTGAYGTATLSISAVVPITTTTVSVQSPANGASVTDPVTFSASGSSPNGISGWVIYMDDQNVYQVDNFSNALTASVNLPAGSHTMYIRAWDRTSGGFGTSPNFTINVGAATAVLPTPPANAKVFNNIEDMSGFKWCSANCAGGQPTENYWMAQFQSSPSIDGSSMELFNGGGPWANTLWYKSLGQNNWASHFLWDFYVYFDATSVANLHTAEFDFYQSIAGIELMVGSQCNFGEGVWDIWDQAANQWIGTSIACQRFSPDTWHHIQWYVERVGPDQYRYVTLVVDGTAYSLNNPTYYGNYQGWADLIGVQWQLDLGPNGIRAHEWVDESTLSIW